MSEAPWLEQAKKDLTLHEIPGPQAASRIKQMFFTVGHPEITSDEVSWCAAAVGTWLREAGYPTSEPIHLNLTGASYEHYGKASAPKKGAICVSTYTRLGRKDWRRHVGIILTDPRPGAKSYKVIGGNQADEVSVINVPIRKVTATRWPVKQEQSEELPKTESPPKRVERKAPEPVITSGPSTLQYTSYSAKFQECLAETLKWEGGYSNDKYDSGGATMRGVTTSRYRAYRKRKGLPPRPVRQVTDKELQEIYHTYYWTPVWGDEIPKGLALAVFDFGVNSGPTRAIRYLQAVLGVRQDGEMGPITLEALEGVDVEKAIRQICDARLRFVRGIGTYWRFGRGWENRIAGIRRACLEREGYDDDALEVAPKPLDDEDSQSAEQGRADEEAPKIDAKTAASIAAPAAGIAGAASQTQTVAENLSLWQHIALGFKSFGNALIEHWPFFVAAAVVWGALVWGIPYFYRKYRK